jgi:hypothetical protein
MKIGGSGNRSTRGRRRGRYRNRLFAASTPMGAGLGYFRRLRGEVAQTGVDMRSSTERNAADMSESAAAAGIW